MKEWIIEAKVKAEEWVRWHMLNTNDQMNPETIEHCIERLRLLEGSTVPEILVRMRNIYTNEVIPAELVI